MQVGHKELKKNTYVVKYIKQNADEAYLQSYQNSETNTMRTETVRT